MQKYFFTLTVSLLFPSITVAEIVSLDCVLDQERGIRVSYNWRTKNKPKEIKFDFDTTKEVIYQLSLKNETTQKMFKTEVSPSTVIWGNYDMPHITEEPSVYEMKNKYFLNREGLQLNMRWSQEINVGFEKGFCKVVQRKRNNKF